MNTEDEKPVPEQRFDQSGNSITRGPNRMLVGGRMNGLASVVALAALAMAGSSITAAPRRDPEPVSPPDPNRFKGRRFDPPPAQYKERTSAEWDQWMAQNRPHALEAIEDAKKKRERKAERLAAQEERRLAKAKRKQAGDTGLAELLVMLVFLGFIMLLVWAAQAYQCSSKWRDSGIDSKYDIGAGCRLKVKGVWIPASSYRNVD